MRFRKLNDFVKESPFEVFTGRVRRKDGKKGGKYLQYRETVDAWSDEISTECKKETFPEKCEKELLGEDLPNYCLFGKNCVVQGTKKEIEKRKSEEYREENPDDSYFAKLQEITEEELEYIF